MKKILSVIMVIALIIAAVPMGAFTFAVSAETVTSGTTGDCTWSLDGTVLTISGEGAMGDYDTPWGTDITEVIIENGVTSIGYGAFWDCTGLTSVSIGDSVTSIADYAFYNCTSLASVTIPDSVISIGESAFSFCENLTSITIPDSVTSIGGWAFYNCISLASVTIPDSVTSIGYGAFSSCTSLIEINVGENNSTYCSIDGVLFDKYATTLIGYPAGKTNTTYTIPDSVTSIGGWAFGGCTGLTNVTIGNSVTCIDEGAFYYCDSITDITIPSSVTTINSSAFEECNSIANVIYNGSKSQWNDINVDGGNDTLLNANITFLVEDEPFWYLTYEINDGEVTIIDCDTSISGELVIPSEIEGYPVTSIGNSAFYDCTSLANIILPDSITSIGRFAFYGCDSLTSLIIPDGVTLIDDYTFLYCYNLASVTIPQGVTSIGYDSFAHCTSLTNITIPNSVTTIESRAFEGCTSLTSITIPNSVTSIGDEAFSHCDSLTNISVDEYNSYYCSQNGVLFDKAITTLMQYPASKTDKTYTIPSSVISISSMAFSRCNNLISITIPSGVTSIGSGAFWECDNLKSVAIPEGVTNINSQTFVYCYSLTSVTIPKSVTSIDYRAFYSTDLTEVIYNGTEGQWNNITIDGSNTPLLNANITFLGIPCEHANVIDGEIIDEGDCLTDRVIAQLCADCGETLENKVIATPGHTTDDWLVTWRDENFVPSCAGDGQHTEVKQCTECWQIVETRIVIDAKTGHDFYLTNAVEPTCSWEGIIAYKTCYECWNDFALDAADDEAYENALTYEEVCIPIDPEAHTFEEHEAVEATCDTDGMLAYKQCIECNYAVSEDGEVEAIIEVDEEAFAAARVEQIQPMWMEFYSTMYETQEEWIAAQEAIVAAEEALHAEYVQAAAVAAGFAIEAGHNFEIKIFDSINHWDVCSACGSKENETTHTMTDTATNSGTQSDCECGYSTFTANAIDKDENVGVNAGEGAFSTGTEIVFDFITETHEQFEEIKEILEEAGSKFMAYDITPNNSLNDGNTAEISFTIPEDFGNDVAIYYVDIENGKYQRLETTIRDGKAYATTNHFSIYVLVDETLGEAATDENFKFAGASLTLEDNISVNYKVSKADVTDYSDLYVEFMFGGKEYTVKNYTVSGDYYVFKFDNIAPNQMNQVIYATLYGTKDGIQYQSAQTEYSVATYCYNMLAKCTDDKYAEFRTLLVDLLNYGAQSQVYTNYNTENLANAQLTDTQKAWGTQENPTLSTVQKLDYETVENPTVKWYGGGLTLEDSVTMRFTIETESVENLVVKIVTADKTYTIKASAFKSIGNNRYYVYFNGLNASQMSEEVYVTVYNGEEAVSNTLRYSIESYAYAKQGGSDTKLSDLVIAMMKYGNAAYNYVN